MIKAFGSYIAVKEIQKQENVLFIGDSVGLEKVVVVSIPKDIYEYVVSINDYALDENAEVYIKVDSSKPVPYVTVDNEKIFFITLEDIVAVDMKTVKVNEEPERDTNSKESK